ncbi:hypothetical protein [Rathayibacter sp. VKM Ac-2805]|uniref:hypothetical protein n=1 Tax=Rathayibacter sp. VKM Ac-2805 TaxID=2609258 RepID=UPI00131FA204|nr:hypothetical protein [Rathayibacter sp. VKM Ac-2805]QHC72532.1 hypothetical protein GSU40_01665 [Rathayibacter sp. VKM Ac-2805]
MLDTALARIVWADGSALSVVSSDALEPLAAAVGADVAFVPAPSGTAGEGAAGGCDAAGIDAVLAGSGCRVAIVEADVERFQEDPARRRRLAERQREHPGTGLWLAVTGVHDSDAIGREVEAARWAGFHTVGASIASPAAALLTSSIAQESDFVHIDAGRLALACSSPSGRRDAQERADEILWHPSLLAILRLALTASAAVPTFVSVPPSATASWLAALFGTGARCVALSRAQQSELEALAVDLTAVDAAALASALISARGAADARRRVDAALSALGSRSAHAATS